MEHGQPLRADEVRRIDDAQLAIDLREDHVEMDRVVLFRHHDDDDVLHRRALEKDRRDLVDRRGARALAEADDHEVAAQRMDVAALDRVVHAPLRRAVVQNAGVGERRVVREQRLHDDRFRPPDRVAHRPDENVIVGDDAAVAREEHVRQRRQHVAVLVERLRDRSRWLVAALDEHSHERGGIELADVARQRLRRDDVHRLADQQVARFGVGEDVGEQRPDLVHRGEALEDGDEPPVLALSGLGLDDVVVQVVGAVRRGNGEQFRTGRVDENAAQAADLRRHTGGHGGKLTTP